MYCFPGTLYDPVQGNAHRFHHAGNLSELQDVFQDQQPNISKGCLHKDTISENYSESVVLEQYIEELKSEEEAL